jgi:phosphoribosylglycinamide formyltransferase-1
MKRIGVLISGRGSNLQILIDAQHRGEHGGEIVVLTSNKTKVLGIKRTQRAGIQVQIVTKKMHPDRSDFDRCLIEILTQARVDLAVLAGYMRMFTQKVIADYKSRIINAHPSLLPAFSNVKNETVG